MKRIPQEALQPGRSIVRKKNIFRFFFFGPQIAEFLSSSELTKETQTFKGIL